MFNKFNGLRNDLEKLKASDSEENAQALNTFSDSVIAGLKTVQDKHMSAYSYQPRAWSSFSPAVQAVMCSADGLEHAIAKANLL